MFTRKPRLSAWPKVSAIFWPKPKVRPKLVFLAETGRNRNRNRNFGRTLLVNNVSAVRTVQFTRFKSLDLKMPSEDRCIFCKIISKTLPSEILYEDDDMLIFKDIKPAAKHHYLAIPKTHITTAKELHPDHKPLVEQLIANGKKVVSENGGNVEDLRLGFHWPPFNSISHLHLHVISPASEMGFISRQVFKPNSWWFATADYVMDRLTNKL